ncbi:class I SAM-dependent methyltransferase [Novilysobacter spongiicola]|uniref:Lysine methyltransferase n=1 Tax=Lysobacter spongiicola DSM 21749 TaxID=1122188 RepID=A0A1T4LIB8_9GAMM|nr:methyltransferase domain-containing protein [Lysobacter spongiicola]SJZ54460.1 Lysine methyltransferase [Lysobacter spongiicola DSM 21749]
MPGYTTIQQLIRIGGIDYRIRALSDLQQFSDPDGHAARLGISSAQWCLFGQLWPAGQLLAEAMSSFDIGGKRILEIGCGLGLASLVLKRRGADVVASDIHPNAEPFLAYNAALNGLPAVPYRQLQWDVPLPALGRFDVIIGSDILYERGHALLLASLMDRHLNPTAEIVVSDPGRGNSNPFTRELARMGFQASEVRAAMGPSDLAPFRGRLLHYSRPAATAAA